MLSISPLFKMQGLAGKMLKVQDLATTVVCCDNRLFNFQVNEDETMVRRKAPVPEPRNVDAETIYVVRILTC